MAQSTTIGVETLLDRAPDNLSEPKDTKFQVNGEHAFANGVALRGGPGFLHRALSGISA
jgi:hypothetical protein